MKMKRLFKPIALLISVSLTAPSHAFLVWLIADPAKVWEKSTQTIKDGVRSAEKVASESAAMARKTEELITSFHNQDNTKAASVNYISGALSQTYNLNTQSKMQPVGGLCDLIERVVDDNFQNGCIDYQNENQTYIATQNDVMSEEERVSILFEDTQSYIKHRNPNPTALNLHEEYLMLLNQTMAQASFEELSFEDRLAMDQLVDMLLHQDTFIVPETNEVSSPQSKKAFLNALADYSNRDFSAALMKSAYAKRSRNEHNQSIQMDVFLTRSQQEEDLLRMAEPFQANGRFANRPSAEMVARQNTIHKAQQLRALFVLLESSLAKELAYAKRTDSMMELLK